MSRSSHPFIYGWRPRPDFLTVYPSNPRKQLAIQAPACGAAPGKTMMRSNRLHAFAALVLAGGALAACRTTQPASPSGTVDTHEAMVRWVNPAALAIWDVSNNAMGETGGLDPGLMDDEAWSKLQGAARLLELHSRHMAEARSLRVGAHNDAVEGFATRAEIQAMIDADPDGFRRLSLDMAEQAQELSVAAMARNVRLSGGLADSLSERCQACHSRYWEKPAR